MKKITQQTKVAKLMEINPLLKPKEIAQRLNMSVKQVYVLRNAIKKKRITTVKNLQFKDKPVSKPTNKVSRAGTKATYVANLEKENKQLTEWTQMWKRKYEVLERDYTQAKVMYLNSQAVVAYLEDKIVELVKGGK
jgi:hypothetical protein